MTPRTPQGEVFFPLLSNSKDSGVSEDSKSPTLGVWVSSSHLAKVGLWHISSTILPPHVYKLVVPKYIMLFTSFQIFQELRSTWAPMPIQLQMASVDNPFRRWRTWLQMSSIARQLLLLWPLLYLRVRHFFLVTCSMKMEFFKGEKLDQMLLKFVLLCSPSIHNLIVSLKHYLGNFDSIDYILKLKALFGYNYI
jgi:hypothetical protein